MHIKQPVHPCAGKEASFAMHLSRTGEAYFVSEAPSESGGALKSAPPSVMLVYVPQLPSQLLLHAQGAQR